MSKERQEFIDWADAMARLSKLGYKGIKEVANDAVGKHIKTGEAIEGMPTLEAIGHFSAFFADAFAVDRVEIALAIMPLCKGIGTPTGERETIRRLLAFFESRIKAFDASSN